MTELMTTQLRLALAPERDLAQRLQALEALGPLLRQPQPLAELLAAAAADPSARFRRAALALLEDGEIPRLALGQDYVDALARILALDPEPELRALAARRLGELAAAADPERGAPLQALLAEALGADLDPAVQAACLNILAALPALAPASVDALLAYARLAPPAQLPRLADIYARLPPAQGQQGLAALLRGWEATALQERILEALDSAASLTEPAVGALADYLALDPGAELTARAVGVLLRRREAEPEALLAVVEEALDGPAGPLLVEGLGDWLGTSPALAARLEALARSAPSAALRIRLLELLADSRRPELLAALLEDPSPRVRERALSHCQRRLAEFPEPLLPALVQALEREPVRALRLALIQALEAVRDLPGALQARLPALLEAERDPVLHRALVRLALAQPLSEAGRPALLRACLEVLRDPYYPDALKQDVTRRLAGFGYREEPELVACLTLLLEQAGEVSALEEADARLGALELEQARLAPLRLRTLYRFIQDYPRAPLDQWARQLSALAPADPALAAELPYLARLTGEPWLLDAADPQTRKENLSWAVLCGVADGYAHTRYTRQRLEQAYKERGLRKRDLLALFERLLRAPDQESLCDGLIDILASENLITPELTERALEVLLRRPPRQHGDLHFQLTGLLRGAGPLELGYRERVFAAFNQAAYSRYCRMAVPQDCSDWPAPLALEDDWRWDLPVVRAPHAHWPLKALYFALNPGADLHRRLARLPEPGVAPLYSLQLLILEGLSQVREPLGEGEFRAIGALMEAAAAEPRHAVLHQQAARLFASRWAESGLGGGIPAPELAQRAAEVHALMCRTAVARLAGADAASLPARLACLPRPLAGLDPAHLRRIWPLEDALWEAAAERWRFGPDEGKADALYRELARAVNEDRQEEARVALERLLTTCADTELVRRRREDLEAMGRIRSD